MILFANYPVPIVTVDKQTEGIKCFNTVIKAAS